MPQKLLAHSHSSFKMFENCPKRYHEQRIKKSVKDSGSFASKTGERVHEQLERRLLKGRSLGTETKKFEPLCQAIEKLRGDDGVLTAEEEMTLNAKLKPTGWFSTDAWLRSKIDVLVTRGDRAWMFDWKTGKRRPDFDQLDMFAVQVFIHRPEVQRITTNFVWLKDNEMDPAEYDRKKDLVPLTKDLIAKAERIEKARKTNTWPAKPSGLCGYCPVTFCEHHKG